MKFFLIIEVNMIQMALFLPLVIGGIASALWREQNQKKKASVVLSPDFPQAVLPSDDQESLYDISKKVTIVDDNAEILHGQRVSMMALAISGSGALVFSPLTLASIPLLSYSTYYFLDTIHRSNAKRKKSALTLFELISVAGSIVTGRYLLLSSLLSFSFSIRKWALQAGNITSVGMGKVLDPEFQKIWVLRNETEVEIDRSELQADDIAVLHTGDIIRMNGEIIKGEGMVEQFSLSGNSQVVPKQKGDPVFSYTEIVAGDLFVKYG